ncbi:MAG TPA: cytochrome c oxidase accessory protein CcoG [Vicinamibacterales bacterium]|nr:cytochrome c oxidase accessory protein CcoG [Vicinamibacterales bacterium]
MHTIDQAHETFRDELASIARDGRRKWIYARQPAGRFYLARTVLSWGLLAFLFLAPFVTFRGLPLVLLDIVERRFVFFGLVFWPQDFYLVVLLALTVLVTLALSTAAFGRVWCGWLCPQTIFMEMLFRKIEYAIDGSAEQQVRRHRGPWTADRIGRVVVKQAIFFALAFVIANVFLAWIIGADELRAIVTDPPAQHLTGLFAITAFSFVFYAVFARFREQACLVACPYGRVMSALIDADTIKVTYDRSRGEPRGRRSAAPASAGAPQRGDCIDCFQCVTVCPTGIDIRNGVQLECLDCTSCIDACDRVMDRIGRPRGLIRLTSHRAITALRRRRLPPRVAAYAAVWLGLVALVSTLVARRPDLDVLVLRQAGTMFTRLDAGNLANFYTVQVFNRTADAQAFEIVAADPAGATVTPLGLLSSVPPYGLLEGRLVLAVPSSGLRGAATPVRFEVRMAGRTVQQIESSFVGPGTVGVGGK